jgi:hypothetical protein
VHSDNHNVSRHLQIYINTKQGVSESVQPCMNCASAVKNYGATKLIEICQACGVCEPGTHDAPDTQEENGKFRDLEER